MDRTEGVSGWSGRRSLWAVMAAAGLIGLAPAPADAQVLPEPDPIPSVLGEVPRELPANALPPPEAVARFEGSAAPGLEVVLSGRGSNGEALRYRWVQTGGPAVSLDAPSGPEARFIVPRGADRLDFLLVVGNPAGIDAVSLSVPVSESSRGPRSSRLLADAGDDQIALVGREVTLNGLRSEPRGQIGYRWIQVAGPLVRLKIEDGATFTFIPPAPGFYRFALVVASGGEISEPSHVGVTVAASLSGIGRGLAADPSSMGLEAHSTVSLPPEEQILANLLTIEGGLALAGPLAEAFEAIALRVMLYESFSDLTSELSRRLDLILPTDPAARSEWHRRIFEPVSDLLIRELLPEGLDLRQPAGHSSPLTAGPRARLANLFGSLAEGLRRTAPEG